MSDSDNTKDNLPKPDLTRRGAFTLAAAIAAFGAGLGMRSAAGQAGIKIMDTGGKGEPTGKAEHKTNKLPSGKAEHKTNKLPKQGQEFLKLNKEKK